jgi:signal transduction histidine kinase
MSDAPTPFPTVPARLLQEIGNVLDAGVFGVDRDLTITAWNPWLESATGMRAASVIGRSLLEVEPKLRAGSRTAIKRALDGATVVMSQQLHGYLLPMKPPAAHQSFDRMQQSARIIPLYADDGSVYGAVAIINDVTERVARERELRAAMEAAEAANKAKSDFLAAMSHELRTPIGAMSGYAELLAEGIFGAVTPVQRDQLQRIRTVGRHLLTIVEEILTFARIEAGAEQLNIAETNAVELVEEAVMVVEPLAARKGLVINRSVPPNPIPMHADQMKVRQILINLLGNAVKFTEKGSISVEVALVPQDDAGCSICFRVADTGSGIPKDDLGRIFEPFVQLDRGAGRVQEGTGLGLSVSRQLARLMSGDLTASSEVGVGTTFTMTLPVVTPPLEPTGNDLEEPSGRTS